jgi:hypothetical protein
MTISIVQACKLAKSIYAPIDPGTFSMVSEVEGVTVGYAVIDGCRTFTFAGSECKEDWIRDFRAVPVDTGALGVVHEGFWIGMLATFEALRPLLVGDISIQGHSLGCAHASILAGLCALNEIPVAQLCLFAPPRPGYQQLRDIVQNHVSKIPAFRNGIDEVPEWPEHIPILEPWEPIADLIELDEKPAGGVFNVFGFHAIDLYLNGVQKLYPGQF